MALTTWTGGPVLIAGPCALGDEDTNIQIAQVVAETARQLGIRAVFKGSFDKANRAQVDAPRGIGMDEGLRQLEHVRRETDLPVLTDVHESTQVATVGSVVDAIQIPAFLCRQTDLLLAAGRIGKPVNIKKGQWMAPAEMVGSVDKVRSAGAMEVAVTERGTALGYGDLVVDMRSFDRITKAVDVPVFFDGTHAVQQSGRGPNGSSGGVREAVPALMRAAAGAGADGFFVETHPRPEESISDRATLWPLDELFPLMQTVMAVWESWHVTATHY